MAAQKRPPVKVAYFSMEMMLKTHIPTYAGGLGVLAGDLLRSCADLEIPAVGISLVYNGESFKQIFNPDGRQTFIETAFTPHPQAGITRRREFFAPASKPEPADHRLSLNFLG